MVRKSKYTKEFLEPIVKDSFSYREVMRKLGLTSENTASRDIKPHILRLCIDTSHFRSRGRIGRQGTSLTDDEIFINDSLLKYGHGRNGTHDLRSRLKKYKSYQCELCNNNGIWCDKPLTLHVDHIDGKTNNNSLDNLRFLCPNCHQQTSTWGGKNRKKKESTANETKCEIHAER